MYNYSTMTRADSHRHPWTTAHDAHALLEARGRLKDDS